MVRYLLPLLLLATPAWAGFQTMPSTPDLSVSATSTAEYQVHPSREGSKANWFTLKNDCASTLYFAITPGTRGNSDYPLRLEPGESFTMEGPLFSVGASNDGASACTFTFQGAQ